jgi:hypothetical protein
MRAGPSCELIDFDELQIRFVNKGGGSESSVSAPPIPLSMGNEAELIVHDGKKRRQCIAISSAEVA